MKTPFIYAPILRGKEGEIRALGFLAPKTQNLIRPMLDIPAYEAADLPARLCHLVDQIGRTWGTAHSLLFDMSRYEPDASTDEGVHPIELLFEQARQRKLLAIPVTGPEDDRGPGDRYLTAVASIAKRQGRGLGLRVSFEDFQSLTVFRAILDDTLFKLEVEPSDVDLYLDAGSIGKLALGEASIASVVEATGNASKVAAAMGFRTIVFSGTSIPDSVGPKFNSRPCRAPRQELEVWRTLHADLNIPTIVLGDYGVMSPLQSDNGGSRPPSRIRLSTAHEHVLFRGDSDEYLRLRSIVAKSQAMREQVDSWGRRCLLGRGVSGPGNATDWVARDTNASLETTCEMLAKQVGEKVRIPHIDLRRAGTAAWRQEGLDLPGQQPESPQ
ncbi:MAG: hypothetical protein AAFY26_19190 [Cyanobacteria bacterium J06638_22]